LADPNWLVCVLRDYGPLIPSGAVLISAAVAVCAIAYNGKMARIRATIDLVMHQRQDRELVKARKKVLSLHHSNAQFSKFALLEHSGTEENEAILAALNAHEFVAVGVREGAFDEKTYKRLRCSSLVRDWRALETYVAEFRKTRRLPTLYQEFEILAKRWIADPLKTEI